MIDMIIDLDEIDEKAIVVVGLWQFSLDDFDGSLLILEVVFLMDDVVGEEIIIILRVFVLNNRLNLMYGYVKAV